ncbi:hypothetical protein WDZ92_40375, partial [Nostoc sp. NIES-2111]
KTFPNYGIKKNIYYTLTFITILTPLAATIAYAIYILDVEGKELWIASCVPSPIMGALFIGQPVIQHFCLRVALWSRGYVPWNYAKFLNYCTERLFLQRVGGRYRFIHKLLQDHFAQMEFKRD